MTAIALGQGAKPGDEALAVAIFDSLGQTTMVDESLMHTVTAVSGSGPAYVFVLAEAMQQAAVDLGMDQATAQLLVNQTICGAGKLLVEADEGRTRFAPINPAPPVTSVRTQPPSCLAARRHSTQHQHDGAARVTAPHEALSAAPSNIDWNRVYEWLASVESLRESTNTRLSGGLSTPVSHRGVHVMTTEVD